MKAISGYEKLSKEGRATLIEWMLIMVERGVARERLMSLAERREGDENNNCVGKDGEPGDSAHRQQCGTWNLEVTELLRG